MDHTRHMYENEYAKFSFNKQGTLILATRKSDGYKHMIAIWDGPVPTRSFLESFAEEWTITQYENMYGR